MFLGVQIVAVAVLLNILIGFTGLRKLPILSSKWYERFLHTSLINLGFETFSLITLYYDGTPDWLRTLAYQLFCLSLIGTMHCFLFFVDIKGRKQKRYNNQEFAVRSLPFIGVIVLIIMGDVNFYIDGMLRYAYGSMITGTIFLIAMYLLSYFLLVFHFRGVFNKRERASFVFSLSSACIILLIQATTPWLMLSSMGIALLAMNVFMTFENPREYADYEVLHAMNKNAFITMINEHVQSKKEFYIVSMTLTNSQIIKDAKGYNATVDYMEAAAKYMVEYAKSDLVYHPKRDWVSLIFTDKQKYYAFMEEQRELFEHEGHEEHGSAKFFMNILKCPQFAATEDEIIAVLDYVDKIKGDVTEKILRVDEKLLDDRKFMKQIEAVVQNAIDNDGFEVYYQPIYSNKEKGFVSAEALVRLVDTETLGYISPEIFIPIAEENGMIREVGKIVFRKVCKFISEKNLADYGVEYIEVNLSGAQFMDDQLNNILKDCAKEYNVPPEFLNLEITETASISAGDLLEYNMRRLKESHFKFSMDDFGTGYSNLAKIAQTDFDLIKLDKSLIWPCFDEEEGFSDSRIILDSSVDMILKLGKDIVAEGVETKEQVDYLTERGVKYLQGFYFSKPLSEDSYLEFMKENS